jgi:hypothetical protein
MTRFHRILSALLATLLTGGLLVASANPAPAACAPSAPPLSLTIREFTYYCGGGVAHSVSSSTGVCYNAADRWRNWGASAINTYPFAVRLYDNLNCSGGYTTIGANSQDPDLSHNDSGYTLWRRTESWKRV